MAGGATASMKRFQEYLSPSHDSARKAAEQAAREQEEPGKAIAISYEDKKGHWHSERSAGDDRPEV